MEESMETASVKPLWWEEHAWSAPLGSLLLELPRMTSGRGDAEGFVNRPIRLSYQVGITNLVPPSRFLESLYAYEPTIETVEWSKLKRAANCAYSVDWTDEEVYDLLSRLTGRNDPIVAVRVALGIDSPATAGQAGRWAEVKEITTALIGNPHLSARATGDSAFDTIAQEIVSFLQKVSLFPTSAWDVLKVNHLRTNPNTPLQYIEEAAVSLKRINSSQVGVKSERFYVEDAIENLEQRLQGISLLDAVKEEALNESRSYSDSDVIKIAEEEGLLGAKKTLILPKLMQDPSREGVLREAAQIMLSRGNWTTLACMTPVLGTMLHEAEAGMGVLPGSVPAEWLMELISL